MSRKLDCLAIFLLVFGGITWGVIGLYNLNIIEFFFDHKGLVRSIYVLFGFAFIYHTIAWQTAKKKAMH